MADKDAMTGVSELMQVACYTSGLQFVETFTRRDTIPDVEEVEEVVIDNRSGLEVLLDQLLEEVYDRLCISR